MSGYSALPRAFSGLSPCLARHQLFVQVSDAYLPAFRHEAGTAGAWDNRSSLNLDVLYGLKTKSLAGAKVSAI